MADSTQTQNSNINPTWDAKATLFGLAAVTQGIVDMGFDIDYDLTMNNQKGFAPNIAPVNRRLIRYFCIGNGGKQNVSNNLTEAFRVSGTDGMPYSIFPHRMLPIEEDLDADTMALYAGRVVMTKTVNGVAQAYATYLLKPLEKKADKISFLRNDSQTMSMVPYVPTVDCMNPTPLVADANGTIVDPADAISTVAEFGITVLGKDVMEVCNVLYNGDMRYANISEFGLVVADQQSVSATDYTGKAFSYTEAIAAQLATHSTTAGTTITGPAYNITKTVNLGLQNISVVIS